MQVLGTGERGDGILTASMSVLLGPMMRSSDLRLDQDLLLGGEPSSVVNAAWWAMAFLGGDS